MNFIRKVVLYIFLSSELFALSPKTNINKDEDFQDSFKKLLSQVGSVSDDFKHMLLAAFIEENPNKQLTFLQRALTDSFQEKLNNKKEDQILKDNLIPFVTYFINQQRSFPDIIDKTQWVVMYSRYPFDIIINKENTYEEKAVQYQSVRFSSGYITLIPPSETGGKFSLKIISGDDSKKVWYKRENTREYLKYAKELMNELSDVLINNHKSLNWMGVYSRAVTRRLKELDIDPANDFTLVFSSKYTTGKKWAYSLSEIEYDIETNKNFLTFPFYLTNLVKRGRLDISKEEYIKLLIYSLGKEYKAEEDNFVTDEDYLLIKSWNDRLIEADMKIPSNSSIMQLSARVPGQRPEDITESQINIWAESGIDHLYLMGVWETSDFSYKYNNFWGKGREASAFAIKSYKVNPQIGGKEAIIKLLERLKKYQINLMLDFVPNHMAMDNDYLPLHPEYFIHEKALNLDGSPFWIDTNDYAEYVPDNWPRHINGKVRFKIWYSKDFDSRWPSDHFLLQELDDQGNQTEVLKFFHGNWNWRDTVQIDYQNPYAREFMRNNYLKAVQVTNGGAIRWDFVHVILKDHFRKSWYGEDVQAFLRNWKGMGNFIPLRKEKWNNLLSDYLETTNFKSVKFNLDNPRSFLDTLINLFKEYIIENGGVDIPSLAPAFHFEGLGELIKDKFFPSYSPDQYREVFDAVSDLRFHEFPERAIIEAKREYPGLINIGEAYENENYLINIGFDAIYSAEFYRRNIRLREEGVNFENSLNLVLDYIRSVGSYWDLKNMVFYLQNFDEPPVVNVIRNLNELKLLIMFTYGLPGMKFTEWGLWEGNRTRLSADYIETKIDWNLRTELNPFLRKMMRIFSDQSIKGAFFHNFDPDWGIRGFVRKIDNDNMMLFIVNLNNEEKILDLRELFNEKPYDIKILLNVGEVDYMNNFKLKLSAKSGAWVNFSINNFNVGLLQTNEIKNFHFKTLDSAA